MSRAAGATEQVKRWSDSDTAKFKTQVKEGKIDIDNIDPKFIEKVRVNHGWEPRSKLNFRDNYKRIVNLIRIKRDLQGRGESSSLFYVLLCTYYLHLTIHLSSFAVAHSNQKDNDSGDDDDEDEEEEEEEGSDNDDDNDTDKEEDSNTIMPPKLSKVASPLKKVAKKESGVKQITESAKKLKIAEPSQPYSVLTLDGCMVKRYARGSNDWVVVEIYIPGVIEENAYTTELSEDGKNMFFKRAIPAYFLENKRLKKMLGNAYHIHDSRVIAHDNVVQQVRKRETENNGLIFAAAAQIIPLDAVCTGSVVTKMDLQKESEVETRDGTTHFQFSTILSCKVLVMAQRTKEKKKAKRTIHVDVDGISEEEASSDEEQDYNLDETD